MLYFQIDHEVTIKRKDFKQKRLTFSQNQVHTLQIRLHEHYYLWVSLIDLPRFSNNVKMIGNFSLNNYFD